MSTQTTAPVLEVNEDTFPSSDGIPMETPFHRWQMNVWGECAEFTLRDRERFHTGGNQFIYWDPNDPRKNVGPDFFFVDDVERGEREKWMVWLEGGRFPDVIMEILSPSTKHKDEGPKKDVFEQIFKTEEYFLYDPRTELLRGWRLIDEAYVPIEPDQHGRLWCARLGVWLDFWEGEYVGRTYRYVRFFYPDGSLVPTFREHERDLRIEAEHEAVEAQRHVEIVQRRADEEQRRADEEQRRADEEQRRADEAEAENARLRSMLQQRTAGGNGDSGGNGDATDSGEDP